MPRFLAERLGSEAAEPYSLRLFVAQQPEVAGQ